MSPALAQHHILLIEKNSTMRARVAGLLAESGYRVTAVSGAEEVSADEGRSSFDAVIAALDGSDREPQRVRALKRLAGGAPLLALCGPSVIEHGVRAMRYGVEDYLLRPPDPLELRVRLDRVLDRSELDSKVTFFQNELSKRAEHRDLEARSPAMRAVVERLRRVAPLRSTVLIYGESGVGKELVARSIHFHSPRVDCPFIALNCAAMPASLIESELFGHEKGAFTGAHARARGKFEIAHRGTIFLDEIGEMDPNTQAKLLRVLEEREFMRIGGDQNIHVDVRVIAATNADLESLVARGRFRRDLYYRLKVITIQVPPLRERREDQPHLTHTFLDQLARINAVAPKAISPEAMSALLTYHWPGNVRELKNLLESVLVSIPGELIRVEDLPDSIRQTRHPEDRPAVRPGTTLADMERELIRQTLEYTGGNRTHSATLLGIGVRTLQRKISSYELKIAPKRRRPRRRKMLD